MATPTNVPQSVEQSKLTVVPFPAPQGITQLELTVLLSLRGRLHQLQEQVEAAEQSIKGQRTEVFAAHDHVAAGPHAKVGRKE
jgi:hypothetical protein